ncbi:MAG: glycosyltransferase family 2 protein [Luteibaculaceae bacterium]
MSVKVQILVATYNGAAYLSAQLDSILAQTFSDWQILIKDDGSTDNTKEIISHYSTQYPEKIKMVQTKEGGSSTKSFMSLLPLVTAPFAMFCDQDDVWLPTKIEQSVALIEKEKNSLLLFTDMQVVDSNLKPLHNSFLQQHKINPAWASNWEHCMVQSMAAGCTMLFRQGLIHTLKPIEANLFQHDHWLLMHAAYHGKVIYLNEKTVLYRQHDKNSVGSHGVSKGYFGKKSLEFSTLIKRWKYINHCFNLQKSLRFFAYHKLRVNLKRL